MSPCIVLVLILTQIDTSYSCMGTIFRQAYNLSQQYFVFQNGKEFLKNNVNIPFSFDDGTSTIESNVYLQCKDHFSSSSDCGGQWKQRYWVDTVHFKPGGPIFLQIGGEGNAEFIIYTKPLVWREFAKKLGALLVVLEHRYYGESWPVPRNGIDPKSYEFLNSRQAIKDLAKFIPWFRSAYNVTSNSLVAFGCSYPGNLAVWLKQKHPKLVKVSVASSAPLKVRIDIPEFMQLISKVVYETNPKCFHQIKDTFTIIEDELFDNIYKNYSRIYSSLRLCRSHYPLSTTPFEKQMVDGIGPRIWATNLPAQDNARLCQELLRNNGSDLLVNYGNFLTSKRLRSRVCQVGDPCCSETNVAILDESAIYDQYSWFWQVCNEFGYFQIADPVDQMLGKIDGFEPWFNNCKFVFASAGFTMSKMIKAVNATDLHYRNTSNIPSVVYVSGTYDPWSPLGVTNQSQITSDSALIVIRGSEHCGDVYSFDGSSAEVKTAQQKTFEYIQQYLQAS